MYIVRLAILIAAIPALLPAADQWIRLTTPHFELLTSAGEKKGREAILYFEQVRSFFLAASPSKHVPDFPVRIIAFRGEKQFKPYKMNDFAAAYYVGNHDRDYIVMEDIQPEHYPVAIHEYTHLIIKHAGLKLPVWMNEGWADLFSTLKPYGKKALVGELIPGRVQTIQNSRWIPLSVLAGVNNDSPFYNERDKANVFYAESWVFMHMLFLDKEYAPHFAAFVGAINAGKPLAEACQLALGKSMADVEKDLHFYLSKNRLFGALFDVKLDKSAEEAVITEPSDFETGMALADILASIRKTDEARSAYEKLAKENPGRPEVEASLGYLAWQTGDRSATRDHFAKALAAGTRDPQMCYNYALLVSETSDRDAQVAALNRAIELKPDYVEARLQLGSVLLAKQDFPGALAALKEVKKVNADQAEWFFGGLAFAQMRTGDNAGARKNAELAKKWAKTPSETQTAYEILRYLDGMEKQQPEGAQPVASVADAGRPTLVHHDAPPVPAIETVSDPLSQAEGKAQKLDCSAHGARLTILTATGSMTFDIPDPKAVAIKNSSEITHDFTCGPQSGYRVVVGYLKPDKPGLSAGVVRTLEF
jgi:Flp pilus assembly protein TadD